MPVYRESSYLNVFLFVKCENEKDGPSPEVGIFFREVWGPDALTLR